MRFRTAARLLLVSALSAPGVYAQVSYTSMPLDKGFGELDPSQPALPPTQIIANFTEKESAFRHAMANYTYERERAR